jgi:hypothetical protein
VHDTTVEDLLWAEEDDPYYAKFTSLSRPFDQVVRDLKDEVNGGAMSQDADDAAANGAAANGAATEGTATDGAAANGAVRFCDIRTHRLCASPPRTMHSATHPCDRLCLSPTIRS